MAPSAQGFPSHGGSGTPPMGSLGLPRVPSPMGPLPWDPFGLPRVPSHGVPPHLIPSDCPAGPPFSGSSVFFSGWGLKSDNRDEARRTIGMGWERVGPHGRGPLGAQRDPIGGDPWEGTLGSPRGYHLPFGFGWGGVFFSFCCY